MTAPRLSLRGAAWIVSVLLLAAAAALAVRTNAARVERAAAVGGPFALAAADGRTVTDRDLLGAPFAIFFGYTRCPDVCPTTLAELDAARDEIGPAADALRVVFVSVDPERDPPDALQDFVGSFAHPVTGLSGTPEAVEAAAKAYGVFYEKVPAEGGDYAVNHTAAVFLMDAEGDFAGTISYGEDHASMVAKLRRLIGPAAQAPS